jgi:DNA relaxase NicK
LHHIEFFVDNTFNFFYDEIMYATEKYVRFELKEIHQQVRELANDLGGDIRYLQQEIHDLSERLQLMETNLEEIVNELREQNGA